MTSKITTITSAGVNCYLVKTETGYVMIDTGFSFRRGFLQKELQKQGCRNGNLQLVIITHSDFDHSGNCAYLRQKYGARIVMHPAESAVVRTANMKLSRTTTLGKLNRMLLFPLGALIFTPFKPDLCVEDGADLSELGFAARIIHIPGHTIGSIGILMNSGEFFSGDLLVTGQKPALNHLMDNTIEAHASIEKMRQLHITMVYPGHGQPFSKKQFLESFHA